MFNLNREICFRCFLASSRTQFAVWHNTPESCWQQGNTKKLANKLRATCNHLSLPALLQCTKMLMLRTAQNTSAHTCSVSFAVLCTSWAKCQCTCRGQISSFHPALYTLPSFLHLVTWHCAEAYAVSILAAQC